MFVAYAVLDNPDALKAIVDMLNAKYGLSLGLDDVTTLGKKVLDIEIGFNREAGLTEAADRLPDYFSYEKFMPHNVRFDITPEELDSVLSW